MLLALYFTDYYCNSSCFSVSKNFDLTNALYCGLVFRAGDSGFVVFLVSRLPVVSHTNKVQKAFVSHSYGKL